MKHKLYRTYTNQRAPETNPIEAREEHANLVCNMIQIDSDDDLPEDLCILVTDESLDAFQRQLLTNKTDPVLCPHTTVVDDWEPLSQFQFQPINDDTDHVLCPHTTVVDMPLNEAQENFNFESLKELQPQSSHNNSNPLVYPYTKLIDDLETLEKNQFDFSLHSCCVIVFFMLYFPKCRR